MKTKKRTLEITKKRNAKIWRTYSIGPFFMLSKMASDSFQRVY